MTVSPYASLQHTEATARAALLTVTAYDVRLDLTSGLDDPTPTFDSVTTIELTSAGGETFLDLKPTHLRSITLDGTTLDPALLVRGRVPLVLARGEHRIVVEAVMPFRNDGEGLHLHTDPADGRRYVYGMSFMDAAPTIFACFDQPDLKAPYTFHVRAPQEWTVIGNAPGTQVEPGVWELEQSKPLATYFVTLVAGPWHLVRDEHDGIPLGLSARQSLAPHLDADAEELLTMTKQCLDEFHRLFGIRYPFGDYHQAFVPEFNAGAMENPGCVTFRDPLIFTSRVTRGARLVRATTVAHEMAHQWFGDLLTPRWWDDLWLNESFAEYLGNRVTADVTEFSDAWVDNAYARRQWGLVADQSSSTHPVAGNGALDASSALQNFDGISYAKGSAVLRQLNTLIGDEAFFGGTVDLMQRNRFGNAAMADLFAAWESASGQDLSGFTDQWLRTAGPDVISLDRAAGVVRRTPPAEHPADRSHTFSLVRGADLRVERLEVHGPQTPLDAGDDAVVLDPSLETWAATLLDETTVAALPRLLPGVADPLVRAGTWSSLRSTLHHVGASPSALLDVVEASVPIEDTLDGKGHTLGWVYSTLLPLCGPDAPGRVHVAALRRMAEVETGSELQLSAFRAAAATATDVDLLTRWLGELPEGLDLDLDLRWRLLVRLAGLGGVDRDELDRQLAVEPTATSTVEHTRAVASMPSAAAKEFAWDRFTGAVDVPNYELAAAGAGMWRGGQEELLAPYVGRYFDDLPGTVAVRSGWTLADAAGFFFPTTSLERSTHERALALSTDEAVDTSIRRRLVDLADGLGHQLAVLERYPRPTS